MVALPLVLPPTVLGFYMLLAMGPRSPIGALYAQAHGRHAAVFVSGPADGESVLYSLPFTVQPVAAAFAAVDRKLIEASWCLGVSRAATFRRVIVPLALPGIATGAILSFAHTMGEFGVVLMVGGNIAGVTRTVSISIYDQVQALELRRGRGRHRCSCWLISFAVLAVTYALQRRIWAVWPLGMAGELICRCRKRLRFGIRSWTADLVHCRSEPRRSRCCSGLRGRGRPRCCGCWPVWNGPIAASIAFRGGTGSIGADSLAAAATPRRVSVSGLRAVSAPDGRGECGVRGAAREGASD